MPPAAAALALETVEGLATVEPGGAGLVASAALGATAAALAGLLVVAASSRWSSPRAGWGLAALTALGAVVELGALLFAVPDLAAALVDRRIVAGLARLLVIGGIVVLLVAASRGGARDWAGAPRATVGTLAALGLLAVPPGLPQGGGGAGLARAALLTLALAVVVAAAAAVVGRRAPRRGPGAAMVAVALVAGVAGGLVVAAPEVAPSHRERLVAQDLALDLTVAPLRPGPNELHVYAWDALGRPATLEGFRAVVDGPDGSTSFELYAVSPDHYLSYELLLVGVGPWPLELQAIRDGTTIRATTVLEAP